MTGSMEVSNKDENDHAYTGCYNLQSIGTRSTGPCHESYLMYFILLAACPSYRLLPINSADPRLKEPKQDRTNEAL